VLKFLAKEKATGFVHFWAGPELTLSAIDPDSAKIVLKSPEEFPKHDRLLSKPSYLHEFFGKSVLSANGDNWKLHRNFLNSGFSTKTYQDYFPTFVEMTEMALSKMGEDSEKGDVDCNSWFSKFTLDLLGNSIFHHDFGRMAGKSTEEYDSYKFLLLFNGTFYGLLLMFFPWIEWIPTPQKARSFQAVESLRSLFLRIIKNRESDKKYGDILDNLLKSQNQSEGGLSQVELFSNLWIFFLAGHETTASALSWACVCLARYQDIQEKLYREIETTIGTSPPTFEDLSKLSYLDCFISEVLRLYPPATFIPTREASADVKVGDQFIPKGSIVGIFIEAIHKHPDFWPEPEKFDPDRFLPENKKGRHHYAYLPFSLGPRQCIGNNFSLFEQRLFLTRLLQKFRVLPPKNSPLLAKDTPLSFAIGPIPIRLEPRVVS